MIISVKSKKMNTHYICLSMTGDMGISMFDDCKLQDVQKKSTEFSVSAQMCTPEIFRYC